MKDLLQKFKGDTVRQSREANGPRVTLGALGKHPGWDDHIPGIGLETAPLAQVKQVLYVGGIGRQIDSGAWEKLESEKRLEGFDHTFLWLVGAHALVGRFWSSTDGKGRSKYPMVVCIDGEGVPAAFLVNTSMAGLERLKESCMATRSAEQVIEKCRIAQDQLRALVKPPVVQGPLLQSTKESLQGFLDSRDFSPDRLGLKRVLHELGSTPGLSLSNRSANAALRSRHFRAPLGHTSASESLLLWAAFLRAACPDEVSVFLVHRTNADWLDAVIGMPDPDDFFCLQAAPGALPLASEIPYQLTPESTTVLEAIESRLLKKTPPGGATSPGPVGASPKIAEAPSPKKEKSWWPFVLCGAGVVVLATAGVLLSSRSKPAGKPAQLAAQNTGEPKANPAPQPSAASVTPSPDPQIQSAREAAKAALQRKDYGAAIVQAETVLRLRPGDPEALRIRGDSLAASNAATLAAKSDGVFKEALDGAIAALKNGQFEEAAVKAEAALKIRPQDASARQAAVEARNELARLAAAKTTEQKLLQSSNAAWVAFNQKDYPEALRLADAAIALRPGDPGLTRLHDDIQKAKGDAANDSKYSSAMKAAEAALVSREYAEATNQARLALSFKPGDGSASALLTRVAKEISENDLRVRNLQAAVTAARAAYDRKEYSVAAAQASAALAIAPGDADASKLLTDARRELQAIPQGQAKAASQAQNSEPFRNSVGMDFVWSGAVSAFVAKCEVTQAQFQKVMGRAAGSQPENGPDLPVINISAAEARDFCERLSKQENRTYYLPSRAEWLLVAGLKADQVNSAWKSLKESGVLGKEVTSLGLGDNNLDKPARVGSRGPQPNGVCDLLGNVREWVMGENNVPESVGFSYDSTGVGNRGLLFKVPDAQLQKVTGFRCFAKTS
jgi:formylglycine-generating enzyme required for sulfatase activity